MTLVGILAFVILVGLLVYLAQNMPPPWHFVWYALAIMFVVIALILILGLDVPLGVHHV